MEPTYEDIQATAQFIEARVNLRPESILILGSGLGPLAREVEEAVQVPYDAIPHFPRSTAPGHAGHLLVGRLRGRATAVMVGRAHMYEGYSASVVALPVRALHLLGATSLVVTNAAGGLTPGFKPGTLMLITDHINLTGRNPLVGANEPRLGSRFPDMTHAYDPALLSLAVRVASSQGVELQSGVYLGLLGPSYETPAEIRMARMLGADAVGMSTVMEVIAANHLGMRVLGISCITNMGAGISPQELSEEEVIETAHAVREPFGRLVSAIVGELAD